MAVDLQALVVGQGGHGSSVRVAVVRTDDCRTPARRLAPMTTVELRSDTFTRPTPAMRRPWPTPRSATTSGARTRRSSGWRRLWPSASATRRLVRPSGTMGNQICLRLAARPGPRSWPTRTTTSSGTRPRPPRCCPASSSTRSRAGRSWRWPRPGPGPDRALRGPDQRHRRREHPQPGRRGRPAPGGPGGAAGPGRRGRAAPALRRARIWNASVASGSPWSATGALFDSMSVCFSKALGAPVGSAVVGPRDLVDRARDVRHLYGGACARPGCWPPPPWSPWSRWSTAWPTTTPTPAPWPRWWPRPSPAASTPAPSRPTWSCSTRPVRHRRPRPGRPAGGAGGAGRRHRPGPGAAGLQLRGQRGGRRAGRQGGRRRRMRSSRWPTWSRRRPGSPGGSTAPRWSPPGCWTGARLPPAQGRAPPAGGGVQGQGAFSALLALDPATRANGVLAVSSGNHGQAVALAAAETGAGRWW